MPETDSIQKSAKSLRFRAVALALPLVTFASGVWSADRAVPSEIDQLVKTYASAYAVPLDLARRLIKRESGFNPRAVSRGNLGLMQIRAATARGLGYSGPPEGLLVAETNLAYGMAYLANALMVAKGDGRRAERYFQTGFYYEAKRSRMLAQMVMGCEFKVQVGVKCATAPETQLADLKIGKLRSGAAPSVESTLPIMAFADPAAVGPAAAGPAVAEPAVAEPAVAKPTVAAASIIDIGIPLPKLKPTTPKAAVEVAALSEPAAPVAGSTAPRLLGAPILDADFVTPTAIDPVVTAATADVLPPLPRRKPAPMALPRPRPGVTAVTQLEAPR